MSYRIDSLDHHSSPTGAPPLPLREHHQPHGHNQGRGCDGSNNGETGPEDADSSSPNNSGNSTDHPKLTKAEQARVNGQKSKGPTTPEGKARSSRNAVKHAYTSKMIVLSNEDPAAFCAFRDGFVERYRPADTVEYDQVELFAVLSWKIKQVQSDMVALRDREMNLQAQAELKDFKIDEPTRSAFATESLHKKGTTLANLQRYENQLIRNMQQVRKGIKELQEERRKNPPTEQNEPTAAPPEVEAIEPNISELTPRNVYSRPEIDPDGDCRSCWTVIRALAPFPQVRDTVRKALLELNEREKAEEEAKRRVD